MRAARPLARRWRSSGLLLLALLAAGLGTLLARSGPTEAGPACTKSWTAAVDGDWSDGTKWTPAGMPAATDDVCVTVTGTYTVTVLQGRAAQSIQIGSTGAGLAEVAVQGQGCSFTSSLSTSATAEVFARGRLTLTSAGCAGTTSSFDAGGGLVVDGTLRSAAANGGARSLSGAITNRGTVDVAQPTTYGGATTFDQQGTVSLASVLTVNGGATYVNRSGATTSTGSGRLKVDGATFEQRAAKADGAIPVELLNSTLNSLGTGSPAAFVAHQTATVSGAIAAGQSLAVEGVGCSYTTTATVSGNLTNAGSISLTSAGCAGTTSSLAGTGLLTNTGSLTAAAGNGGTRELHLDVRNQGSVVIDETTQFDAGSDTFDNRAGVSLSQPLRVLGAFTNTSGTVATTGSGELIADAGAVFTQANGNTTGAPVEVRNSTLAFAASSTGSSQFTVHQAGTLTGDVPAGATVAVEGVGCSYPTSLDAASGFTNAGTIRLTSAGCAGTTATLSSSGLVTNTGTIASVAGNGGSRYLRASVRNQGTVSVAQPLTADLAAATFTNEGTLTLTQAMTVSDGTVRNQSGSIDGSGAGRVSLLSASTFQQGTGDTSGNPVVIQGSSLAFLAGSSGTTGFVLHQTVALSGNVPSGASILIEGVGCSYATTVTAAGAFSNAGSITLGSAGCAGTGAALVGPGLITNTGTIATAPGNGGTRTIEASIRNQGTVAVGQPLAYGGTGSTFTNEGTVTLTQPVTATGVTIRNTSGSIDASGAGQLTVASSSTFQQDDGDTTGNPVVVLSSNLAFLTPSTGTSSFVLHQAVGLSGDVPSSASLLIEGVGCSYATTVTAAGAFSNAGSITLGSAGCAGTGAALVGPGLITNTGTIATAPGNGGTRTIQASIRNQGTVTVDQPLAYGGTGSTFTNEGTVTLTQPMTADGVTFRNLAGSIDGSGSGRLTIRGGSSVEQSGGNTSGNPVTTQASSLAFLAPSTGDTSYVMHQSGSLIGDVPSGAAITIEGIGCSYATAITAPSSFTNAGTISLSSGGCAGTTATLDVGGTLTNTGTIASEVGNGGPRRIVADAVDNQGTIHLASGAPLTITGDLDLGAAGTLEVEVTGPGANGRVVVSGSVSFGGALQADTTFTPTFGATFQVATYGSSTGSFDDLGTTGTQFTADYQPTQLTISVLKASSISLMATPAGPTVAGQAITFTAHVMVVSPDTGTPTGSVRLFDGTTSLGTAPVDGTGTASLAVTSLPVGNRSITAEYLGAPTIGHSTSSPVSRQVDKASTTTALVSSPNPSDAAENVVFTATVAVVAPGAATITGQVQFKEGATVLGTSPVVGGVAQLTTPTLHVGNHTVIATYVGDAKLVASTSPSVVQTVTGVVVPTATTLTAPSTLVATQAFSLTAKVTSTPAGAIAGDVEFREGATVLGTAAARTDGTASLRLARGLGSGTHRITAAYLGGISLLPSTSHEAVVTVTRAQGTFTTTAELDLAHPGVVRFIVVATAKAPASSAPSGAIVLRQGDLVIAEGRLSDGRAVVSSCFTPVCAPASTTTTTTTTAPPTTTSTSTSTSTTSSISTSTTSTSTTSTTDVPSTLVPGSSTTEAPTTTAAPTTAVPPTTPAQPTGLTATAVPAVAVPAPRVLRPLAVRAPSTLQVIASYPGDADFDAYESDPIPVEVDGDTVSLPAVQPEPPTTAPPTTPTTPVPTTDPSTTQGSTPLVGSGSGDDPDDGTATGIDGTGTGAPADGDGTSITGDADGDGIPDAIDTTDGSADGADETAAGAPTGSTGSSGSSSNGSTGSGAGTGSGSASGSASGSGSGSSSGDDDRPRSLSSQFGRSTLASSTANPTQISTDPKFVLQNVLLTMFLLLFSVYPAYLINSTIAENYDEVMGWLGPAERRLERFRARRGKVPPGVVLGLSGLVGALLYSLLDPNIGLNMPSFALFAGLFTSTVIISGVYDFARQRYLHHHYGIVSSLRAYPVGIAIAVLLVVFSRAAHFTPGYLFGVFTALGFATEVDRRHDGKGIAAASLWLLGIAVTSWVLWVPVAEAASKPHAGFVPLFLDTTLASVWIIGIQALVFGLMPLRFLDGEKLLYWSRWGWAAVYSLGMFAFVHSMVRPGKEVDGDTFASSVVLFVGFTAFAVSFWAYFRLRTPPPGDEERPTDGPAADELIDA